MTHVNVFMASTSFHGFSMEVQIHSARWGLSPAELGVIREQSCLLALHLCFGGVSRFPSFYSLCKNQLLYSIWNYSWWITTQLNNSWSWSMVNLWTKLLLDQSDTFLNWNLCWVYTMINMYNTVYKWQSWGWVRSLKMYLAGHVHLDQHMNGCHFEPWK